MLRLSKLTKNYNVADTKVEALKGINLAFRQNEFVSILGPSGCGKTTLLNIIGGLDKSTSGNLYIAGRSTKEFKDSDWDVYRNSRIGFIFQSYNLIPHQTVLANVELALTIAGMGKAERTAKAKQALDKVGLKDQYYKRPNQLSGGQSQRVAIARALVNDPEILLADEPTGALDTTTSVQIMELVKEIAQEKLVIMVTHNPALAEQYSTRIINLLDGELQSDSNPFSDEDEMAATAAFKKDKKVKRAKMSFPTAFKLSLLNLFSKKARTTMTSIAGSIGIIGVSLVLSISFGVQAFIKGMQDDMLSGNPIRIEQTGMNLSALAQNTTRIDRVQAVKEAGFVNVDSMIAFLSSRAAVAEDMILDNTITQEYIDYVLTMPEAYAADIFLNYGLDVTNNIFTDFYETPSSAPANVSLSAVRNIYTSILEKSPYSQYASYVTSLTDVFMQMPGNANYILSQYDMVEGKMAEAKNEVMIVLDGDSMLTDLLLSQLGYYTQEEFLNMVFKSAPEADGTPNAYYDPALDKERFSHAELLGKTFVWYPNDDLFEATESPYAPFTYNAYHKDTFSEGVELTVVGILEPKPDTTYGCLTSALYYTDELTAHIIAVNGESQIVRTMKDSERESISSGAQTITLPDGTAMTSPLGITFEYEYSYLGERFPNTIGFIGSQSPMMSMAGTFFAGNSQMEDMSRMKSISLQELGGNDLAQSLAIYPVDFEQKDFVLEHLDRWNADEDITFYSASQQKEITINAEERDDVTYTDALSLIISMINNLIAIITFALVGFTSLSLVVSCVMIGIITYVSVVERTKEIGVIRSLGGRKRDVSNLFTAETFIIGLTSGLVGIGVTYVGTFLINLLISSLQSDISTIAIFPWNYALIMVCVSIGLTLISGLMPSRSAAKKDPAVALRTE